MADTRTLNQKLKDKHPPVAKKVSTARQTDARHQGAAKK
jgi:hypothetical protein